jgi:short-subunit dehydrogenase
VTPSKQAPMGAALVTGASAGVGRATALELAERGYDVALLARGHAGLEAAAAEVKERGRRACVVPADVSVWQQVDAAATAAEEKLGPLSLWVNNAMTTVFSRVADTAPGDFARAVDVTFLGQVHGTMAALTRMRPRDSGTIVNVGSALAFVGIPLQAAYCSSKFACRGFFEAVRAELLEEQSNVRIRMVHLPAVNTPQFEWCKTTMSKRPKPVPPVYQPEVAARAIADAVHQRKPERLLGAWNRLVVAAGRIAPDATMHYAAMTGTSSQLTDAPVRGNRPANLRNPADDGRDYGAHGEFGDTAGGSRDPAFLRSLPKVTAQIAAAITNTVRDRRATNGEE